MAIDRQQQQEERLASIRAAIEPVLRAHAVDLADVAWTTEPSGLTLRVTIERALPAGTQWRPELGFGVNLDDCANASRDISTALDAIDELLPDAYSLEVSSPGLDRPLRGAADFARFEGALVKVKLRVSAADGQRVLRGKLASASDGEIAVVVDGKRLAAKLEDVSEAQLVFELEQGQKPSTKRAPARSNKKAGGASPSAKRVGGSTAR